MVKFFWVDMRNKENGTSTMCGFVRQLIFSFIITINDEFFSLG